MNFRITPPWVFIFREALILGAWINFSLLWQSAGEGYLKGFGVYGPGQLALFWAYREAGHSCGGRDRGGSHSHSRGRKTEIHLGSDTLWKASWGLFLPTRYCFLQLWTHQWDNQVIDEVTILITQSFLNSATSWGLHLQHMSLLGWHYIQIIKDVQKSWLQVGELLCPCTCV